MMGRSLKSGENCGFCDRSRKGLTTKLGDINNVTCNQFTVNPYLNYHINHSFQRISRIDPSLNSQKSQLSLGTIVFVLRCLVQKIWCQQFNKILGTFFLSHPVVKVDFARFTEICNCNISQLMLLHLELGIGLEC